MVKRYSSYNSTNSCDCGGGKKLIPGDARKEYINEKWTGRWLTKACCDKGRVNNTNKERKKLSDFRNDNLDIKSPTGKGLLFQSITTKVRCSGSITISKDPLKRNLIKGLDGRLQRWYDKYRVDEQPYNNAYQEILKEIENGNNPYFRNG